MGRHSLRGAWGTTSKLQPEKPAGAWLWLQAPGAGSGKTEGWSALGVCVTRTSGFLEGLVSKVWGRKETPGL